MEKDFLRSCQLVEVIRVVTKEGDGTKENPVRESTTYFTTDGMLIGTLVNSAFNEKSPAEQGEIKQISAFKLTWRNWLDNPIMDFLYKHELFTTISSSIIASIVVNLLILKLFL